MSVIITLQLLYLNQKIEQKIKEAERHQKVTDYSLETLSQAGDQALTDIRNSFDQSDLRNSQKQLVRLTSKQTIN